MDGKPRKMSKKAADSSVWKSEHSEGQKYKVNNHMFSANKGILLPQRKDNPLLNSDICPRIKKEEEMDCRPYAVTCSQGNPVILPEVFVRIKKEDYSNLYGSVKEETRNAHIKGGLVFNPDTLLWIKQVDDPEITRHKDSQTQVHELQSNRQLKQQAARSPVGDRYSGTTSTSGPDDTFGDPVEGTSQAHEKHSVSLCMTSTVCRDSLSSDEEDTISDPPTPQQVSSRSVLHQESSLQTHQSQLIKHMESQTSTLRSVDKNLKRLVSAPVCLGKHLKDLSKQVGCLSASLKMFKNDMLAIQTSHNTCLETFATIMENQQASMQRMEDILSQMSMNNCAHGSSTSINQPQVTSHVEITSTSSPVALRSIRPLRRATQNIDVPFKKSKQK
ncbi:uncharacterized protein LOC142467290 isoform X5 [Ascaphus truei]|uniref:uncharacterized protein LOC142467290 isoform X5 n=1 Tax=Ascaphus truei TaxID=8439 RepID=UPI003F5A0BA5